MAYDGSVPYDNDPRTLKPTNRRLKTVRESEGPSPTQDGPESGVDTGDLLPYIQTGSPLYDYLGRMKQRKFVEEGHNTSAVSKKVSKLVHEGKPQKQAVATALSMKRAGRLTKSGGYRRVGK